MNEEIFCGCGPGQNRLDEGKKCQNAGRGGGGLGGVGGDFAGEPLDHVDPALQLLVTDEGGGMRGNSG